jgi:hypothetical protein
VTAFLAASGPSIYLGGMGPLPILLVASLASGAKPKEPPAPPPPAERVIVLDIKAPAGLVSPGDRGQIERRATMFLNVYERVDATAASEVREMFELEAARQSLGCDTESCASEIAGAAGARYVLMSRLAQASGLLVLTLQLVDSVEARTISRGQAQGVRFSDLFVQLPFAIDQVAAPLRVPTDPPPAELLARSRPRLMVLPLRGDKVSKGGMKTAQAAAEAAAKRGAMALSLTAIDVAGFLAISDAARCGRDDLSCGLPAAAAQGAVLGLGVSVFGTGPRAIARASLLRPDGTAIARAERSDKNLAAAVEAAVDEVFRARAQNRPVEPQVDVVGAAAAATDDDTMVRAFRCGLQRGLETVGGNCTLTKTRLRFAPNAVSFQLQVQPEDIAVRDIAAADPAKALGLVDNRIRLSLKSGGTRELAADDRDAVLALIRGMIQSP